MDDSNLPEMMRKTLDYDHGQRLLVFAHVMKRPVQGKPGETEYYVESMVDVPAEEPNSSSCVIMGSPMFDTYDEAVLHMNDRLAQVVEERHASD